MYQRCSLNPRFDGAFLNWIRRFKPGSSKRLNPRFDGAFLNWKLQPLLGDAVGLNPRFDGAFLNWQSFRCIGYCYCVLIPDLMGLFWILKSASGCLWCRSLNPRFDGAFLNFKNHLQLQFITRLNPRFDGAFLNSTTLGSSPALAVLIPDLMGLFWIRHGITTPTARDGLNPRFDGAFLN